MKTTFRITLVIAFSVTFHSIQASQQKGYSFPENFVVSLPEGVLPEPAPSPALYNCRVHTLVGAQISSQATAAHYGWLFENESTFTFGEIVMMATPKSNDCPKKCRNPFCLGVWSSSNLFCTLGVVIHNQPDLEGRFLVQYNNQGSSTSMPPCYLGKFGVKGAIGKRKKIYKTK